MQRDLACNSVQKKRQSDEDGNHRGRSSNYKREVQDVVRQFKYPGRTVTDDARSNREIKIRIVVATSSLTKLKPIWRDKITSMKIRISLLRALITSVCLYRCETWTVNTEMENRISVFEMNCMRRLLQIHYS